MDKLNENAIKQKLNSNFFSKINIYDVLESTNITAKELANKNAKNGSVILAEQQTAGKGRLGRNFYSPENSGIYMSVILRLDQSIDCSLLITSAAAVAVCRAIEKMYNVNPQIKWVNDVYLNHKKICGILTEASINYKNNSLDYIIVGIGINVSTTDFPNDIKNKASSILTNEVISNNIISRNELIAEVLNQLEIICGDLEDRTFINEYKNRSCVLGCDINVISMDKQEFAKAIDITDNGYLIVKTIDGEIKQLSTGEITIRKV